MARDPYPDPAADPDGHPDTECRPAGEYAAEATPPGGPGPRLRRMVLLAYAEDEPAGVVTAWAMNAYSPGGLVRQVAEVMGSHEVSMEAAGLRRLNPDLWRVRQSGDDLPAHPYPAAAPSRVTFTFPHGTRVTTDAAGRVLTTADPGARYCPEGVPGCTISHAEPADAPRAGLPGFALRSAPDPGLAGFALRFDADENPKLWHMPCGGDVTDMQQDSDLLADWLAAAAAHLDTCPGPEEPEWDSQDSTAWHDAREAGDDAR
jgi:hypothetical protein